MTESKPSTGLIGVKEAAEYLDIKVTTLYDWRVDRKGPAAIKQGRLVKYRIADLDAWIEQNREVVAP